MFPLIVKLTIPVITFKLPLSCNGGKVEKILGLHMVAEPYVTAKLPLKRPPPSLMSFLKFIEQNPDMLGVLSPGIEIEK